MAGGEGEKPGTRPPGLAITVTLVVLAVGGAILWYATPYLTGLWTQAPAEQVAAPAWESVRQRVLPTPAEPPPPSESKASPPKRRPVDERITRIANNLNAQFSRDPGNKTAFTDRFPRRLLEMWVFQESGVPEPHLARYVEGLIAVSEAIGQDQQINRIGSIDDRAQVIVDALEAFREEFLAQVEQAEGNQTAVDAVLPAPQREAKREARPSDFQFGSSVFLGIGAFALLAVLVLVVTLLRRRTQAQSQRDLQTLLEQTRNPTARPTNPLNGNR